jgi:hypothetical protein
MQEPLTEYKRFMKNIPSKDKQLSAEMLKKGLFGKSLEALFFFIFFSVLLAKRSFTQQQPAERVGACVLVSAYELCCRLVVQ